MSGNGWCTHPDRQVSSDVRILVRKAELACRNAWGSDLWEPANAEDAPAAQPAATSQPQQQPQQPAMPVAAYDDEVTSVVSADEHAAARPSLDDEVVDQSIINFNDNDHDYDWEQDERRDLLYRDSRSAIERARQRHAGRRITPARDGDGDDDVVISEGEAPAADASGSLEPPTFEPDDFIEEEAPTSTPVDENDDALISEGVRTPTPRSRRLRRFREERKAPKEMTAAEDEPEPERVEPELPPSAAPERGRFDSIPEISADIDLPLLRRQSSAPQPEAPAFDATTGKASNYDRALKRAHELNRSARAELGQQRRRDEPVAAIASEPVSTPMPMPDLPEMPQAAKAVRAPGASIDVPAGTSAVLHPRPNVDHVQDDEGRARIQSQRQARVRADEPLIPAPDARQSWWRGARNEARREMSAQAPSLAEPERRESQRVQLDETDDHPVRSEFDLRKEDDLESFRSRLFAGAAAQPEGDREDRNAPVTVARRERRPITPPTRQRPTVSLEQETAPDRSRPAPNVRAYEEEDLHGLGGHDEWYEPEGLAAFDVRDLIADEDETELLDMTIEIAPKVPRACVTCRNYRPSEQPGRGWCTNSWAFTHRQMVNESDLACDSTIGCWWLPADEEVWLDEFEVAADATPRVDRLLARMSPERRAVGN